jgi:hypothetical protein
MRAHFPRACSWLTRLLASAGGKKSPTAQATASAILGASAQVSAPKVVTHKGTKLNDAKPWNSETWARSTWLF